MAFGARGKAWGSSALHLVLLCPRETAAHRSPAAHPALIRALAPCCQHPPCGLRCPPCSPVPTTPCSPGCSQVPPPSYQEEPPQQPQEVQSQQQLASAVRHLATQVSLGRPWLDLVGQTGCAAAGSRLMCRSIKCMVLVPITASGRPARAGVPGVPASSPALEGKHWVGEVG